MACSVWPAGALADERRPGDDPLDTDPPRFLAEMIRVVFGFSPRVDGDTVIGLYLGASQGQGVPPYGDGVAFGLSGLSEAVLSHGMFSLHTRTALGAGFGSNRIYGVSEQTLDAGIRLPFGGSPLGVYARGGLDVGAYGDSRLYTSRVALPYGRVGLQWVGDDYLLEAGAAGAPVLAGRFNVGDDGVRTLSGAAEVGPTLLLTTPMLTVSGELRRIGADETGGPPMWLGRASACGALRSFSIGMCMHFSYGEGDVLQRESRDVVNASSFFGGWTVGYLVE